jgi:dienelactone hydrolase
MTHAGRTPVSDTIFGVFKNQFSYDSIPLEAQTIWIDSTHRAWIEEKVVFNAAYDNKEVIAHLFLPRNTDPPFQTVIYYPHAQAFRFPVFRSEDWMFKQEVEYFLKDGRAVLVPVLWGMFQRRAESFTGPYARKNNIVRRILDIRRSLDYLESRSNIDTAKLCLFGNSFGGVEGPIALAVDERFETGIFFNGGLPPYSLLPEVDPFNYVSHIRKPVLMVNGKYDLLRPVESHVYPLYKQIGTTTEDKELKLIDAYHGIPEQIKIRENLEWLDRYFGPVNKY